MQDKVEALKVVLPLQTKKDLQQLLGLASYYQFIPHYTNQVAPVRYDP